MIYQLARAVETTLKTKRFPVEVYYSGEHTSKMPNRTCVTLERDRGGSDSFEAPRGSQPNPRGKLNRNLAAEMRVFAKSSLAGARVNEHEALADQIVDACACAIVNFAVSNRVMISLGAGRFLSAEELDGSVYDKWPGVVYVQKLTLTRGVFDVDFNGEGAPEVTLDRIETT